MATAVKLAGNRCAPKEASDPPAGEGDRKGGPVGQPTHLSGIGPRPDPAKNRALIDRLWARSVQGHTFAEWWALARFITNRKVSQVLGGRRLAGAAKWYVDSLYGTSGSHAAVRSRVIESTEVMPPRVVEFQFPEAWPAHFRRSYAFDARVRHRLRDVVVSPLSGLTWTPCGRVLGDSIGSAYRLLGWGNVAHELLFPEARTGLHLCAVCSISDNYGHWLFESLPNIMEALEGHADVKVLLPGAEKDRRPFVEESLRLALGDRRFENVRLYAMQPQRIDELVLTTMPRDPYFVPPWILESLRRWFGRHLSPAGNSTRRVYISRRGSPKRRMDNEEAIESYLVTSGYDIVRSEDLSFLDRLRLFSECGVIVGPHGAGMANIAWCSPGTRVVEILPPTNFNDYFARLALLGSLRYQFVTAVPGVHPGGRVVRRDLDQALAGSP